MAKQKKQDKLPQWMRETFKRAEWDQKSREWARSRAEQFFASNTARVTNPSTAKCLTPREKKLRKLAKRKEQRQAELKVREIIERDKNKHRFKNLEVD